MSQRSRDVVVITVKPRKVIMYYTSGSARNVERQKRAFGISPTARQKKGSAHTAGILLLWCAMHKLRTFSGRRFRLRHTPSTKSPAARSSGRQAVCRGGGRKHSDLVVHRSELEDQVHGTGLRHFLQAPAPSLRVSGLLFFDPPLLSHSRTRPPFLIIPSYHHSSAFLCKHLAVTPRALVI